MYSKHSNMARFVIRGFILLVKQRTLNFGGTILENIKGLQADSLSILKRYFYGICKRKIKIEVMVYNLVCNSNGEELEDLETKGAI